jgi:Endonuclease NucS C-terminal domain
MPVQRHNVVIPREDGGVEVHPLKEWLRQHPEVLPGVDPNLSTSHQLRSALRRLGWTMQQTPAEIRLIMPGTDASSEVVAEVLGASDASENPDADVAPFFTLEYQLRDFIASNLNTMSINGRRLRLWVDPTGRDGVEFPSAVGPIDILAVDDSGSFFVFELKRANGSDRAIGQLTRYMGWVRQTIGRGHDVFGVIVAKSIGENLRYSASVVPNVHLFEYEVKFQLKPAHDLTSASANSVAV